jgi:hypothetical protein
MTIKMPEVKIVATGTVGWPPIEEMRAKIIEWSKTSGGLFTLALLESVSDHWITETYKIIASAAKE